MRTMAKGMLTSDRRDNTELDHRRPHEADLSPHGGFASTISDVDEATTELYEHDGGEVPAYLPDKDQLARHREKGRTTHSDERM